jgi:hypothetical protein
MTRKTRALSLLSGLALILAGTAATAEFAKITDEEKFRTLVAGKTLTRPLVRLQVTPEGGISGTGVTWEVTGSWDWRDGFFCRDLYWGGSDLGYNCQEVAIGDGRVRFTSDRGAGDFADFRLSRD